MAFARLTLTGKFMYGLFLVAAMAMAICSYDVWRITVPEDRRPVRYGAVYIIFIVITGMMVVALFLYWPFIV